MKMTEHKTSLAMLHKSPSRMKKNDFG